MPDPIPAQGFSEAPVATDMRNPLGWLLHLRANDIAGLVTKINELFDPGVGERSDLTNLVLLSYNPAVIDAMQHGATAEQALGYDREMDPDAIALYDAIKAGATRMPAQGAPTANGGGSQRAGGGASKFDTSTLTATQMDALPSYFVDKLTRNDGCPNCGGHEFWDNRVGKQNDKAPDFKCANRDCDTGKGYAWGAWEKEQRSSSSRTR